MSDSQRPAVGEGTRLMVTGHRDLRHRDLVVEHFRAVLTKVNPKVAISGGAAGADTLFALVAVELGVPLWLFLPNRWYRSRYPQVVSDELLAAAADVRVVVDRPEVADWRERWDRERWWVDNFTRNKAMVGASTDAVVVSPHRPRELATHPRGGTAACVKDLGRARPDRKVIWVPDRPDATLCWAPVTGTTAA